MSKTTSYSNETISLIGSGSFSFFLSPFGVRARAVGLFFAFTEHYLPSDLFRK